MGTPRNRGFTLIRTDADGSHQIKIYAKRPRVGETPFAQYTGVNRVVIRTSAGFAKYGDRELSLQPVAVSWSTTDGAVYVEEQALTRPTSRCRTGTVIRPTTRPARLASMVQHPACGTTMMLG